MIKKKITASFLCALLISPAFLISEEGAKKKKAVQWKPQPVPEDVEVGNWTPITDEDQADLQFKKISVGTKNHVWGVSTDDVIYKLLGSRWIEKGEGIDVAVGRDGTVISIDAEYNVFKFERGEWEPFAGVKLTQVSVGGDGLMWGTYKQGEEFYSYRFVNGVWQPVQNQKGEAGSGFKHVSVNAQGIVFAIDDEGNIHRRDIDRVKKARKRRRRKKRKKKRKRRRPKIISRF